MTVRTVRFSSLSLLALIFSAVQLHRAEAQEADSPTTETKAEFVSASDAGHFELVVADVEGKPIPSAQVEVRSHPKPQWEVLTGKFLRKARYGTYVRTDGQGRMRIKMPDAELSYLNCSIRAKGYGPFWAGWTFKQKTEVLPASYTARLDPGQSVGGIIVDPDGKPIVGAEVHPSIEYKKRETDESQLGSGWRTKTDKDGRWRADCVPATLNKLSLSIAHPKFVPTYKSIVTKTYRLEMDETPHEPLTLQRGVTLGGTVTDQDGAPIKNAKIRVALWRETREARTGADGKYQIVGCPPDSVVVTITAKTFSPDQAEVALEGERKQLDFKLEPGRTIRVRVVDKDGNPEKKARIFFRSWRKDDYGRGLDTVHQYTDENGIWEWNEAPADAIVVDVCPVGKLQIGDQTLIARDEEYLYTSSRQLTIEGIVVDSETKKPIDSYRVIPGLKWPGSSRPHWSRRNSFDGRDGKFHYKVSRMDATHLIRVEAPGYAPLVSRDVNVSEGQVKFRWQLKKAPDIQIKIERPDGTPAKGAEVAVGIAGAQLSLRNSEFSNTYAARTKVDQQGALKLNPEIRPFVLLIVDAQGYTQTVCDPKDPPESIRLTAWGSITGTVNNGQQPAANVTLVFSPQSSHTFDRNLPYVSWHYNTTTDKDGNFQFSRVPVGKGILARQVRTHVRDNGYRTQWSHSKQLTIGSGQKMELAMGGDGRAVFGQAFASEKFDEPIDWGHSVLVAQETMDDPPSIPYPPGLDEDRKQDWVKAWLQTPVGMKWQQLSQQHNERRNSLPRYVTAINKDGTFRIENVPPGEYEFELTVEKAAEQRFGPARTFAIWKETVEIPKSDNQDPFDLGDVVVLPK